MKNVIPIMWLWIVFYIAAFPFVVTMDSCSPKFSVEAVDKTKEAWAATDALYDKIAASTDKNFSTYEDDYLIVHNKIRVLQMLDDKRKHNGELLKMINDIEKRFGKYEEEHKATGTINNTMADIYKKYMTPIWRDYYNAENHLNKPKTK